MDDADRVVIDDGLHRAGWQWESGREYSSQPATISDDLHPYAVAFISGVRRWLNAANRRTMSAEIFQLPQFAPLRIIRFFLLDGSVPSRVDVITPQGDLVEVIRNIGERLNVPIASSLTGARELRIHGPDEVILIKPAARRFWMRGAALEDADTIVSESFVGALA